MPAPKSSLRLAAEDWENRRRASGVPLKWDAVAIATSIRAQVAGIEESGMLDPGVLDPFEAKVLGIVERSLRERFEPIRDVIRTRVAKAVVGDVAYANRIDAQIAHGASAVAEVLIEESLLVAVASASLRACASQATLDPVRPPGPLGPGRGYRGVASRHSGAGPSAGGSGSPDGGSGSADAASGDGPSGDDGVAGVGRRARGVRGGLA